MFSVCCPARDFVALKPADGSKLGTGLARVQAHRIYDDADVPSTLTAACVVGSGKVGRYGVADASSGR